MTKEEFKEYLDKGIRVFQVYGHPTLGSGTYVKYTGSSKYVVDNYRFFSYICSLLLYGYCVDSFILYKSNKDLSLL